MKWTEQFTEFRKKNEAKLDITFFICGFIFDAWMVAHPDEPLAIFQQALYLFIIALLIHYELLFRLEKWQPTNFSKKIWPYQNFAIHFCLGTLLNVYSIFYIKSASIFSSAVFLFLMFFMIFMNELPFVKKSKKINLKVGLYSICLFSFFSIVFPLLLGFIGLVPFCFSVMSTLLILLIQLRSLRNKVFEPGVLFHAIFAPIVIVVIIFTSFFFLGLIPPVPLSAKEQGVYHYLIKRDAHYYLYAEMNENSFWNFGKSTFHTEPGDKIYFYSQIFSPARISDKMIVHWFKKNNVGDWESMDKVPVAIKGGREEGFRAFTFKSNFDSGEWKILVETSSGVEISRLYFNVVMVEKDPSRNLRFWSDKNGSTEACPAAHHYFHNNCLTFIKNTRPFNYSF